MKHDTYLMNIAFFMIFLIVSLPIYSSSVMGANINDVGAYGSNGVKDYRAKRDVTIINVSVTVPEDSDLGTGQVKILEDPTKPFNCVMVDEVTQTFNCGYEYPEITLSSAVSVARFTVQVFNDAGSPISPPRSAALTVDSQPPKILSDKYVARPDGIVEATYEVRDIACEQPECANKCAGIAGVKFTVAGTVVGQSTDFEDGCQFTKTTNLTGLIVGGDVGEKHICIEATDRFGQVSTSCKNVMVDARPPEITGIRLLDLNNNPIKFTNGQPLGDVTIEVNITEHSKFFNPLTEHENEILIDASQLSERPEHQEAFKNRPAICDPDGENKYTCTTGGFFLIMSGPRTVQVVVSAEDEHENKLNQSKSIQVTFDNVPPVATRIYSNYPDDKGNFWVSEENSTIFMDITEVGAGMANRYVVLDFAAFGTQHTSGGSLRLNPTKCKPGWTCEWNRIDALNLQSNTALSLSPQAGSRDDANNILQSVSGTVRVDREGPEVDDDLIALSNITSIGETHDVMNILTSGDIAEIHLFVKDWSGIKSAKANLSMLVENGPEELEGVCEQNQIIAGEEQRIFECVWETDPVLDGYLKDISIPFTFEDYTGHVSDYVWDDIEILANENETGTRWYLSVAKTEGISPSLGIDRLSWAMGSQRMYYKMNIRRTGTNTELVSVNFDPSQCFGLDWIQQDTETNEFMISRAEFADFADNPTADIVTIQLNPGAVPEYYTTDEKGRNISVDSVNVTCFFTFRSIIEEGGERSLTLPEDANITFVIPVYNNPLGQNIGNIKDKIKAEEEYIDNGGWKFVYWANLILQYAREICRFIETYIQLMSIWAGIKDIFGVSCDNPTTQSWACPVSNSAGTTTNQISDATDGIIGELYYFCGLFISCRLSENARDSMNAQCNQVGGDQNENWCKVKKWWGKWSNMWAEYASLNFLQRRSGALGSTQTGAQMGGRNETRGLSIFSVDSFDPTRSMISSALSLCLPGVVMNLEKFRQIKCKRLLCWKIDVPNGRPLWQCNDAYAYDMCTFWTGQAFSAIPIFQFVEQIGNVVNQFVDQPASTIVGMAVDKTCQLVLCGNERSVGCKICKGLQYASSLTAIITDLVTNTKDRFAMVKFDLCEEALKDNPSYDNIEWPGGATTDVTEAEEGAATGTTESIAPEEETTETGV